MVNRFCVRYSKLVRRLSECNWYCHRQIW